MEIIEIRNPELYKRGNNLLTKMLDTVGFKYNPNDISFDINETSRLRFKVSNLRFEIYDFRKDENAKEDYYRTIEMMKKFSKWKFTPTFRGRSVIYKTKKGLEEAMGWYVYTV